MNEKTILLVDDDKVVKFVLTKALSEAGYQVATAETAEEALAAMAVNPAEVLILDLSLPGMNGVELCREMRKRWPWCIVIAVTAFASVYELVSCREAGFEDYFIKPVDMEELMTSVAYAFKKIGHWKERWSGIRQELIDYNSQNPETQPPVKAPARPTDKISTKPTVKLNPKPTVKLPTKPAIRTTGGTEMFRKKPSK
jgi:DNA-binding response OmpR family regulator